MCKGVKENYESEDKYEEIKTNIIADLNLEPTKEVNW